MKNVPPFLTEEEILFFHQDQLKLYGGKAGVRDLGLLYSAMAQPEATFEGQFLHSFPFGMAAAYAYHISQNQPFIDGNKRVALDCALTFLELCEITIEDPEGKLYQAMIDIANKHMGKEKLESLLKSLVIEDGYPE